MPLPFLPPAIAQNAPVPHPLSVRIDLSEPEILLSLVETLERNQVPTEAAWAKLFATEGYRRLKAREAAVKRPFEDAEFKAFVTSEALRKRAPALRQALEAWRTLRPEEAARKALAYLPQGARIQATIYPVIKPKDNSFVFDLAKDPALFVYLDPDRTAAQEENTLVHELHHIGLGSLPHPPGKGGTTERQRLAHHWVGAFGEGFAMLAAVGSPDVHPHATSPQKERDQWDADLANFPTDVDRLSRFFGSLLDGSLSGAAAAQEGAAFYGVQGPWYTVGWRMAAVIEHRLGKARLIGVLGDPVSIFRTWNEAADAHLRATGTDLPRWPPSLIQRMGQASRGESPE